MTERDCTCHPDDRPPTCQHRYAASECQEAYRTAKVVEGPNKSEVQFKGERDGFFRGARIRKR